MKEKLLIIPFCFFFFKHELSLVCSGSFQKVRLTLIYICQRTDREKNKSSIEGARRREKATVSSLLQ